jgi:uncharacterized protein YndB with AHSA1/START domain
MKTATREFRMTYNFQAPKKLVFNAFADINALNEWWGPAEAKNTALSLDFRKGGTFHFEMDMGGQQNYGLFVFGEIQPYDLLEFTNAFADKEKNVIPAPFDMKLPARIFYRLIFTEHDGVTTITLTGEAVNASEEEIEGMMSIKDSMKDGFGATFAKLENYLTKR